MCGRWWFCSAGKRASEFGNKEEMEILLTTAPGMNSVVSQAVIEGGEE
jgi:hypothetical protein